MNTQPTYHDVEKRINECISAFTFTYNGINCGFDPYYEPENDTMYCDIWYGDKIDTIIGINNALNLPIFDDKILKDIFNQINIIEY